MSKKITNNTYIVKVMNIFSNLLEIEARDPKEARELAKDKLVNRNTNEQLPIYYEVTLPEENWGVIDKKEFEKIQSELIESQKEAQQYIEKAEKIKAEIDKEKAQE